jgi:hypothetical protein
MMALLSYRNDPVKDTDAPFDMPREPTNCSPEVGAVVQPLVCAASVTVIAAPAVTAAGRPVVIFGEQVCPP